MSFVSTVLTYIALNALEILMPSVDTYSIGWKVLSLSFPKLFSDWKLVEYQESYEQKCVDMFCIDCFEIYTIECIMCFDLHIDSVDKQHSIHYSIHCMLWSLHQQCQQTIYICLTSLTHAKCGTRSTLCWKVGNISGSTELFAL